MAIDRTEQNWPDDVTYDLDAAMTRTFEQMHNARIATLHAEPQDEFERRTR